MSKFYSIHNKPTFSQDDHVSVLIPGTDTVLPGRIIGRSTEHIIDFWIIQFDGIFSPQYPYSAAAIPHTAIVIDNSE